VVDNDAYAYAYFMQFLRSECVTRTGGPAIVENRDGYKENLEAQVIMKESRKTPGRNCEAFHSEGFYGAMEAPYS
jgi:hypothetical protein